MRRRRRKRGGEKNQEEDAAGSGGAGEERLRAEGNKKDRGGRRGGGEEQQDAGGEGGQGEEQEAETGTDESVRLEVEQKFVGMVEKEGPTIGMTFQVAAVKKALASVWRICRAGNEVQFSDDPEGCFVRNKATGRKVMMEKKGGSYVLRVEFVRRRNEGEGWESLGKETVTIDSGAEESVCPMEWGAEFGMKAVAPGREMRMVSAGGGEMRHYGSRKVQIRAASF